MTWTPGKWAKMDVFEWSTDLDVNLNKVGAKLTDCLKLGARP